MFAGKRVLSTGKIDTTRNSFPEFITPIPISSTPPTIIKACGLKTERKCANQPTGCIINGCRYKTVFRELIWNPRLRVKRIRIVLQQLILRRFTDAIKSDRQNRVCEVLRGHFRGTEIMQHFPKKSKKDFITIFGVETPALETQGPCS